MKTFTARGSEARGGCGRTVVISSLMPLPCHDRPRIADGTGPRDTTRQRDPLIVTPVTPSFAGRDLADRRAGRLTPRRSSARVEPPIH
ncbi:hypothetical protein CS0771_43970 [Catellatospora sp. IY07-71]|nr:hypothetical protein CS0771_43970 [Catellatospora sp. IY07-71]